MGVFDPMQICEEIAKIVDQERVMNVDQIIEKIRERFSVEEDDATDKIHQIIKEWFQLMNLECPECKSLAMTINILFNNLLTTKRKRFSEKEKIKEAFFAGRRSVIDNKKPSGAWIEYDRLNTK